MAPRLVFCEKTRDLPSLCRGWRTPDPSPTRAAACAAHLELRLAEIDAEAATPRGRSRKQWSEATADPTMTEQPIVSRTPSPSPIRGSSSDEELRSASDAERNMPAAEEDGQLWLPTNLLGGDTPTSSATPRRCSPSERTDEASTTATTMSGSPRERSRPPAKAPRLVFCEKSRELPNLRRGWRTPDPSPTRSAACLPSGAALELRLEEDDDADVEEVVETQWRGRSRQPLTVPVASEAPRPAVTRTPSPSPVRSGSADSDSEVELTAPLPVDMVSAPVRPAAPAPPPAKVPAPATAPVPCYAWPPMSFTATPAPATAAPQQIIYIVNTQVAPVAPVTANTSTPTTPPQPPRELQQPVPAPPQPWQPRARQPCQQQRQQQRQQQLQQQQQQQQITEDEEEDLPPPAFSAGSVGHPHCCSEPCKYARKRRGCKDGAACNRCHLCPWKKHSQAAVAKQRYGR